MPTVEELDRLTALLARLAPIADQRPGELIEAGDWNLVVASVIETARVLVEAEARGVEPHSHPDQVQIGWLDPRLRQLIEGGPLTDPKEIARVDALERADAKLTETLAALRDEIEAMRGRMRDVATRDIERESSVNVVRRKVEGIADGRADVLAVRESLESMRDRVTRAVELAEGLEVGGQPPDLGKLDTRLAELESVADRLRLPSGELLDGATFERRLAEAQTKSVTQADLDQALEDRRAQLDPADQAAIEDSLRSTFESDLAARDAALRSDVDTRMDAKLSGVDALVSRAVADATPGITAAAAGATRQELDARLPGVREQAAADARALLDGRTAELRAEAEAGLDEVRKELSGLVGAQVDQRMAAALGAVQKQLDGVASDLKGLGGRVDRAEAAAGGLGARVDGLDRQLRDGLSSLRAELTRTLEGRLAETEAKFDARLNEIEPRLDATIDTRLVERDAALRKEITTIARDEVVGLEDRLPGLVAKEIERRPRTPIDRTGAVVDPRFLEPGGGGLPR
jgi:hypothetical protein